MSHKQDCGQRADRARNSPETGRSAALQRAYAVCRRPGVTENGPHSSHNDTPLSFLMRAIRLPTPAAEWKAPPPTRPVALA
jgi:hypothetical protein